MFLFESYCCIFSSFISGVLGNTLPLVAGFLCVSIGFFLRKNVKPAKSFFPVLKTFF